MKKNTLSIVSFLIFYPFISLFGQSFDSVSVIRLHGKVFEALSKRPVETFMVVNKRTQHGFFTVDGLFEVNIFSSDTLLIGSQGFKTISLCLFDSIKRDPYEINIFLEKLSYQAKEVEVFGSRDLDKIQEDIEKLGYNKKDYILSDIDALNSPITFLYQQFSRKERAKRDLAELKNNDRRRDLLKELFARYVAADIMDLKTGEFDSFIDYCNVSDEFMQTSTQYEFILYIKKKYNFYRMIRKADQE